MIGCFVQAPGDGDASPPDAVSYIGPCCSSKKAQVARGIIWPVDSLILSYQLGVLYYPERCPKKETFLVKAPLFESLSNFALFYIVKEKISQAVERRWRSMDYAIAAAKNWKHDISC